VGSAPPVAQQREVWYVDLDPIRGHEQAGHRPAVVISVDAFSAGLSELAIVVPLTTTDFGNPLHVPVVPPEAGLRSPSWAMPEMVRSISRERLVQRWGTARPATIERIVARVRLLTRVPDATSN
jgi:mRNA interferase MazF